MAVQKQTRSPLRDKPLPQAGQSLDTRIRDIVADQVVPWLLAAAAVALVAFLEWVRFYLQAPPSPTLYTGIAVIVIVLAAFKIARAIGYARRARQGRDGERIVAETLQQLASSGWRIFHDIPAGAFNVDHVVIGRAGVFAIETKTRSKPTIRDGQIIVDERGISIDNAPPTEEPIAQAKRQAEWLASTLQKSTGKSFRVRPVVLFPGWYIKQKTKRDLQAPWVLEPKAFVKFLNHERPQLADDEVALAAYHLERYARTAKDASQ